MVFQRLASLPTVFTRDCGRVPGQTIELASTGTSRPWLWNSRASRRASGETAESRMASGADSFTLIAVADSRSSRRREADGVGHLHASRLGEVSPELRRGLAARFANVAHDHDLLHLRIVLLEIVHALGHAEQSLLARRSA